MRKDIVENIEIGVGQHMAENVLALLTGLFFMYTFITAKILYTFLSAASLILMQVTCVNPAPALKRAGGFFQEQKKGMIMVITGLVSPWVKEKVFVVSALTFKDVKDLITGTWSLTINVAVAMQVLYAQPLPLKWVQMTALQPGLVELKLSYQSLDVVEFTIIIFTKVLLDSETSSMRSVGNFPGA
ncbi:uncharacterized protein LACBIDRAFT_332925 [Laccaria bicolor S238N-H82]|uniref:Predicted protein n=1 Tax=Laccaria bicolor (strain S238N-H82 / ATCC MYA-4686) TaxID=486041 RepID=B0DUA1_LACBS|nr:uncharacterized protein LACBIDRAFT_332925 [Laccaria bicolor S238N-H82]EDR01911.1 predicted protein [Laccaria bicolor S238N-H82]|eukprot:XP_001887521.1 predicted protein [Laccaria bicolor S238N-H82]